MSAYLERRREAAARMEAAKRRFSEAARASMRGDPRSGELAREAFDAITTARAELRALQSDQREGEPR